MAKPDKQNISTEERAKQLFDILPHVHEIWINESTGEHHLRETKGCKYIPHEERKDTYENKRKDNAAKKVAHLQENKITNIDFQ